MPNLLNALEKISQTTDTVVFDRVLLVCYK
jgi:hypothetical protein